MSAAVGVVIPAYTPHNSFMGDVMATPFWAEKESDLGRFLREGKSSGVLEKYGVDAIIVPVALAPEFERLIGAGEVLVV
jgi:hypothetical protein